ncbi:MAG: DUF5777 family beta-barrel protein [Microscillaceae bacterium]|nr:DUF5777 family beta-barrel protein [Microscillaceae bacterium]
MTSINSKFILLTLLIFFLGSISLKAQDDLLKELDKEQDTQKDFVSATFKGTRLINGHSVETKKKKELDFLISHRFGTLNSGFDDLFGLDASNIRLALEYGVTDFINLGVGRSSFEKNYDGFLKVRVLRQSQGAKSMPISLTAFASVVIKTLKSTDPEADESFSDRMFYSYQLLLARKFNERLSLQLMPTLIHRNQVPAQTLDNDIFALGVGGRFKFTKRMSLNLEYYYQFNDIIQGVNQNVLAIGIDIETGGHVFQLQFTNAQAMIEKGFIAETTGDFFEGDIHFGFNISRTFQLGKSSKKTKAINNE